MSGLSSYDSRRRTCPNLTSPTGRAESTRPSPVPPVSEAASRAGGRASRGPGTRYLPTRAQRDPGAAPRARGLPGNPGSSLLPSVRPLPRMRRGNRAIFSPHLPHPPGERHQGPAQANGRPASCPVTPASRPGPRVGPGGRGNDRDSPPPSPTRSGYLLLPAHPPTLHGERGGPAAGA